MKLEHPAAPLHPTADVGTAGLSVFSMDDFVTTHGPAIEAEQDAASKLPPQKKIKTANIANSLNPNNAASNAALPGAAPVPVAVGARTSKYTILLHEKVQGLGIERPEFVFEGDSTRGWCISTSFLGQELGPLGPFSAKQQGKEALSEQAYELLLEKEKEGGLQKKQKEQKEVKMQEKVEKKAKEAGPNWSGQLLEFQRARSSPQPLYTDYNLGTQYSCLLTLEGLDSHPEPFGSTSTLFSSKKAARQHAASCAVQYFKEQGLWPENVAAVGGIKKKKVAQPPPEPGATNPLMTSTSSADAPTSALPNGATPAGGSYPQQAAQLAAQLGLSTPEWRFLSEDSSAPGFHTVSCFFRSGGPHEGPIGEVRHIFGKKKAKEECARLTVAYLQGVRERRSEYGARVMAGIQGGNGVGEAAVKEGYEGETGEGMIQDGLVKQSRHGAGEESDEEFEDAVEEV